MTQNTGWSQGGNDGASDATRPLQSVNGRPIYHNSGYQQAGYQTTQNAYSQAYPQNGYGYHATAAAASRTPERVSVTAAGLFSPRPCLQLSWAVAWVPVLAPSPPRPAPPRRAPHAGR